MTTRLLLLVILTALGAGCTTLDLQQYKLPPSAKYDHEESQEDLAIAVQPFTDKEALETQFGTDLVADKILPALLIVQNRSTEFSYVLNRDSVKLVPGDSLSNGALMDATLKLQHTADGVSLAWIGALIGGAFVPPIVAVTVSLDVLRQRITAVADEVVYSLGINELHTRTVSPQKTVSGFVYFKVPEAERIESWLLCVDAVNIETNAVLSYAIPFEFKWNQR
jgi:hypothetical protein